jgi:hypothetical protein
MAGAEEIFGSEVGQKQLFFCNTKTPINLSMTHMGQMMFQETIISSHSDLSEYNGMNEQKNG